MVINNLEINDKDDRKNKIYQNKDKKSENEKM